MKLRSSSLSTVNATLYFWSNNLGRSSTTFTVYRMWPYGPSNDVGNMAGSKQLKVYVCFPGGSSKILPFKKNILNQNLTLFNLHRVLFLRVFVDKLYRHICRLRCYLINYLTQFSRFVCSIYGMEFRGNR